MFKMAKKIYLEGGNLAGERPYLGLERGILSSANNKVMFVLDFARHGEGLIERKEKDKIYFNDLGAEEIYFASDCSSSDEINEKIKNSEVLYLPGGDTELLLEKIKENNLEFLLRSYEGIIFGNSAGAYACATEYPKIREGEVNIIKSLGLVNFVVKAHYTEEFDKPLLEISKEKDVYGIANEGIIVVENGKLNYIGDIYLFSKGEKIKVI